jgi:MFS family permease
MRVLFAVPDYRRLWLIGAAVGISRWLEFLALGVFAYEVTQSPPLVALVAIVRMVPYILLGMAVGTLADYFDRRRMLIIGYAAAFTASAALTLVAVLGMAGYAVVLLYAALSGFVWTTDMPLRRQLMVDKVGSQNITAATSLDSSTMFVMRTLGPLLGGAFYQWSGIAGVFFICTLGYAVCVILSSRLEVRQAAEKPVLATARPSPFRMLLPPIELLLNRPLMIVLGITVVFNIWGFPVLTMMPVIGEREFSLSPTAIGALSACEGIGGTMGALVIAMMAGQRSLFPLYYFGVLSFLGILVGLSVWLVLGSLVVGLLLLGVASAAFAASQYALVYMLSPPEMRGRASGFLALFIGTSTIGFYNTGRLFDLYPTIEALRIMGLQGLIALAVLGALWLWARPARTDDPA